VAHTETKCRRNDDDDDAGEDDQYYEDGWDEDEAGGVGLRCRQNNAPTMEAMQGNEKGRKLHAVASLFEPLLHFRSQQGAWTEDWNCDHFPGEGPKWRILSQSKKSLLCPPVARKEKCTKAATTQAQPIFVHYITFHYVTWHYILHYTLHKVKLRYITKH